MKKILLVFLCVILTSCVKRDEYSNKAFSSKKEEISGIFHTQTSSGNLELSTLEESDIEQIEKLFEQEFKHSFEVIFVDDREVKPHHYFYAVIQEQSSNSYPIGFIMDSNDMKLDDKIISDYYNAQFNKRTDKIFEKYFGELMNQDVKVATKLPRFESIGRMYSDDEILNYPFEIIQISIAISNKKEENIKACLKIMDEFIDHVQNKNLKHLEIDLYVVDDLNLIKTNSNLIMRKSDQNESMYTANVFDSSQSFEYIKHYSNSENKHMILEK